MAGTASADGVEGAGQVDREDRVPLVDREFLDRRDMLDAGIVDQDIDRAEFLLRGPRSSPRCRPACCHVGAMIGDADIVLASQLGARAPRSSPASPKPLITILEPAAAKRLRDAKPDAAGRSRHNRRLARQHHVTVPFRHSSESRMAGECEWTSTRSVTVGNSRVIIASSPRNPPSLHSTAKAGKGWRDHGCHDTGSETACGAAWMAARSMPSHRPGPARRRRAGRLSGRRLSGAA